MNVLLLAVALVAPALGDVYLHVPRGSNNRLNEQSANRNNADRLFDSQNNNRGGYNVGDLTDKASGNDEGKQYRMKYFTSSAASLTSRNGAGESYLTFEWTNQHGCGGNEDSDPHKLNCNLVIQYMCQEDVDTPTGASSARAETLRNGVSTSTQEFQNPNKNENEQSTNNRRNKVKVERGLHESWDAYNECYIRDANAGLFTADQLLKKNSLGYSSAIHTRQNSNGNRRGYECPEERDYFPYWHPTAWKDIAVLAENQTMCRHYQSKSFNVQPYHQCVEWWDQGKTRRKASRYNNEADCEDNNGVWTEFSNYLEKAPQLTSQGACTGRSKNGLTYRWAVPYDSANGRSQECLVALNEPECSAAPWSRSNHLGNGRDGLTSNYTWVLPHFPSGKDQRCVVRMRYNISTDDYDPYTTDASHNQDQKAGVQSPVQQNPYVEVGAGASPLRLAINTAQFGRTFQDRTHVFILRPRPNGVQNERIHNLNVRGKRGNIVQTYPAVEYDFAPNTMDMQQGDLVHVQWTGSNTHNNGNPAGDGQAGDAGEGTGGTDRNNIVQIGDLNENFPLPYESTTMWEGAEIKWIYHGNNNVKSKDLAISMASAGYYMCVTQAGCPTGAESAEKKNSMQNQLNNAPASYEGALLKFKKGTYHYTCSRNNNFTNRSQKGTVIVR